MTRHKIGKWTVLAFAVGLGGCSSLKKTIDIRSTPEKATVTARTGEKLGETPLTLTADNFPKGSVEGIAQLTLTAPGHLEKEVIVEMRGKETYEVKLTPMDDAYFQKHLLIEFAGGVNDLVKELLRLQVLVMTKRLDEANRGLAEFQRKYPNVAASYVLLSNVEFALGNDDRAAEALYRARTLDPRDAVILRMLRERNLRVPDSSGVGAVGSKRRR